MISLLSYMNYQGKNDKSGESGEGVRAEDNRYENTGEKMRVFFLLSILTANMV